MAWEGGATILGGAWGRGGAGPGGGAGRGLGGREPDPQRGLRPGFSPPWGSRLEA